MNQQAAAYRGTTLEASTEDQRAVTNEVSDDTGQFDPRFNLWRKFCADHGVDVDSLPGDLTSETKEKWETLKEAERYPK